MGTIIRRMFVDDIPELQQVAKITWNNTYHGIIPSYIQEAFLQRNYSEIYPARNAITGNWWSIIKCRY